ncbi:MAG: glycosyltransferase family 2 protein [Bacteroidota bacterium]
MMALSVIIRTQNSAATIKKCLESIKRQSLFPQQIIVVDNNSSDDTIKIAKSIVPNITIILYPSNIVFNYSKAINIGIAKSMTKYLMILSSHVELIHTETISNMANILEQSLKVKAVSMNRSSSRENLGNQNFVLEQIDHSNFKGRAMYNYCSMLRKADWQERSFNEDIPRCEDQEWIYYWLAKEDNLAVFISKPHVYYSNPYYNAKKDIWDFIVMGRFVYPYYKSFSFIRENISMMKKYFLARDIKKLTFYTRLTFTLLREKVVPVNMSNLTSTYNKKLNK